MVVAGKLNRFFFKKTITTSVLSKQLKLRLENKIAEFKYISQAHLLGALSAHYNFPGYSTFHRDPQYQEPQQQFAQQQQQTEGRLNNNGRTMLLSNFHYNFN